MLSRARCKFLAACVLLCPRKRNSFFIHLFNSQEENNKFHTAAVFGAGALLLLFKNTREETKGKKHAKRLMHQPSSLTKHIYIKKYPLCSA